MPLPTFWALALVWFFPWTAFLPAAFAASRKPANSAERALTKLALSWVGIILGFFSLSTRLEHYAFPVLPPLSLLVGVALGRTDDSRAVKWAFRGLAALGVAALAVGLGAGIWFGTIGHRFKIPAAEPMDRAFDYETDFSILADMPAEILRNLLMPGAVTIVTLAIGFLAGLWFETHRQRMKAVMSIAAVMMVVCGLIHWSLIICEDMISSKKFALAVAREVRPGDHLMVVGDYESANSLNFYQPLRVEVLDGLAYALMAGLKYQDAPRVVLTQQEFAAVWRSGSCVFALVPKARLGELKLGGMEMLAVLDRVLVRNR